MHPTLRLYDGYDSTSPKLRDEVKELQELLDADGFSIELDGLFGRQTEAAVKTFQREQGLDDDGVVGPLTWAALLGVPSPYPTTFAPDAPGLLAELVVLSAYKNEVQAAADKYDVPRSIVVGIGSRECGWGLKLFPTGPSGTGDFAPRRYPTRFRTGPLPPDGAGFGRGLMQIDYDAHAFARSGSWRDAGPNIEYGVAVLGAARDALRAQTSVAGNGLLRAAVAAYNCGLGNVLRAVRDGRDLDFYTAGRNYSADVLNRAGWFQARGW